MPYFDNDNIIQTRLMLKSLYSILVIYLVFLGIPKASYHKTLAQSSVSPTVLKPTSNNPLCMMQLENSTVVDLSSLCVKTIKQENLNLSPEEIEMKAGEARLRNQTYQDCKRINRPDSVVIYPFKKVCEKVFQQNF